MSFKDKLAAAKNAKPQTRTVTVSLDAAVAEKRNDLLAQLERAQKPNPDARLSRGNGAAKIAKDLEDLEQEFAGALVELSFERVPGDEWADYCVTNPPRPGVLADMAVGNYNVNAVVRLACLNYGGVLEDGVVTKLTEAEWDELLHAISGVEAQEVNDSVFSLNVGEPARAVELAKKALAEILSSGETSAPQPTSE